MSYTPLWGSSHSVFAVVPMKKTDLDQFLTPDLDYSETGISQPGEHPVIYMLNRQKIRILLPFFIMHYYEMIPLIPYVHFKKDPSKNYQTSPILYVSSLLIVIGARIMWHLNKVWAKFDVDPKIQKFPKIKYLSAKVFRSNINAVNIDSKIDGETGKPADFPNVNTLTPLLSTDALIVSYASGSSPDKYWTAAYRFTMEEVQPCISEIDVLAIDGLPAQKFNVPGIQSSVYGSFRVYFKWKLPWPGSYDPGKQAGV